MAVERPREHPPPLGSPTGVRGSDVREPERRRRRARAQAVREPQARAFGHLSQPVDSVSQLTGKALAFLKKQQKPKLDYCHIVKSLDTSNDSIKVRCVE